MIQRIRGFRDILPDESGLWQHIERTAAGLFADFGFKEIRIPLMERTELFARSIGEDTDIVEKEMYTLTDRGGDQITLRPEATASVVRAYLQNKLYASDPLQKVYTIGPMFRRERPQKGRYRQFYQINVEVLGSASALVDAQLIFMLMRLMARLEVRDVSVHLNSLGCPECRPAYRERLLGYIDGRVDALCSDCRRRRQNNPLRVLDCKVPDCRQAMAAAPAMGDHLCDACKAHFETCRAVLTRLDVSFKVDNRLVRGLDYYTRTTFEIQTSALGAQSAVAGGGRYDGLMAALGGPPLPATGFAIGLDRLVEIVAQSVPGAADRHQRLPDLFVAALGPQSQQRACPWIAQLADKGVWAEMDFEDRSLKSQMKRADRSGAPWTLIVGERELAEGELVLRNMQTKQQHAVSLETVVPELLEHLMSNAAGHPEST